jgi:hypothetical protein
MSSKVLIDKKIHETGSHWDTDKDKTRGNKTRYRKALNKKDLFLYKADVLGRMAIHRFI